MVMIKKTLSSNFREVSILWKRINFTLLFESLSTFGEILYILYYNQSSSFDKSEDMTHKNCNT